MQPPKIKDHKKLAYKTLKESYKILSAELKPPTLNMKIEAK